MLLLRGNSASRSFVRGVSHFKLAPKYSDYIRVQIRDQRVYYALNRNTTGF
jgi:hypothetical protein